MLATAAGGSAAVSVTMRAGTASNRRGWKVPAAANIMKLPLSATKQVPWVYGPAFDERKTLASGTRPQIGTSDLARGRRGRCLPKIAQLIVFAALLGVFQRNRQGHGLVNL